MQIGHQPVPVLLPILLVLGQLSRENELFLVPVRIKELGPVREVWPSRPAVARPFSTQYVCMYVCVCVCVFIKLHITAQSGLVILVILCPSH